MGEDLCDIKTESSVLVCADDTRYLRDHNVSKIGPNAKDGLIRIGTWM